MDDEKIYNAILDELHANGPRQGLWAKCFAEANGNENAAKALYFKYRAQQLVSEESSARPASNSTELDFPPPITSTAKIEPVISTWDSIALFALVVFITLVFGTWFLTERRNAEISKAEDIRLTEERMKEATVRNIKAVEKKERFNNLYATLPDFNFDKEWRTCKHISNTLSQAEFRSCVLDLLEVSNSKIEDLKNKFISATNESSGNDPVSYALRKHNEIQSTWCDTFIDSTWGQGNGVVVGVAECKITLNTLLGKTLRTIAANYSNPNLTPTSFSKNLYSNSHITCNDEDCFKKIKFKIVEYQQKIEDYLNSKESSEKYENLSESSRLVWLQSLEKTVLNSLILSDHICKKLATLNQSQQLSHNSTECEISLGLFWIDEFSSQYENFRKK